MHEDEFVEYDEAIPQDPLDPVPTFGGEEAMMMFSTGATVAKNKFLNTHRLVRGFLDGNPRAEYHTKNGGLRLPRSGTVNALLNSGHADVTPLQWLNGNVLDHPIDHFGNVAVCCLEADPAQQKVRGKNTLIYIAE